MSDHPRILQLRRRVLADPASPLFAELAEEYRRAGNTDEAIGLCRSGLVHHPDHLSARVTLGRALIEIDKLDEAFAELTSVLDAAPGNLPAIRALAEIYQRRGMMSEAMVHYRRALQLAQPEHDLPEPALDVQPAVDTSAPPIETAPTAQPIADLFDFDALLAQLDSSRAIDAPPAFVPLKLPLGMRLPIARQRARHAPPRLDPLKKKPGIAPGLRPAPPFAGACLYYLVTGS